MHPNNEARRRCDRYELTKPPGKEFDFRGLLFALAFIR